MPKRLLLSLVIEEMIDSTFIIGIATAIVLIFEIALIWSVNRRGEDRRKKENTINYINDIRDRYRPIYIEILEKYNVPIDPRISNLEDEDVAKIQEVLSIIEHLGAGIGLGVFDIEVVDRTSGRYFKRIYSNFSLYIRWRRELNDAPSLYSEFEDMISQINRRRESYGTWYTKIYSNIAQRFKTVDSSW